MSDWQHLTLADTRADAGCTPCDSCDAGQPCTAHHAAPVGDLCWPTTLEDWDDIGYPVTTPARTYHDGRPVESLAPRRRRPERRRPRPAQPSAQLALASRGIA